MTPREFIINRLNKLSAIFPEVFFRYEFKKQTNSHIIEVTPLWFYENSEDYLRTESEFETEFERVFPEEQIIFISEGSLTEIENCEFELGFTRISADISILD